MFKLKGKILLLNGGGLDSSAQLILADANGWDISSLHIDYGQVAAFSEHCAVSSVSRAIGRRFYEIDVCRSGTSNFMPITGSPPELLQEDGKSDLASFEMRGRNLMFASLALAAAGPKYEHIMLGLNANPTFSDTHEDFLEELNRMFAYLKVGVTAIAPFSMYTKAETVTMAYNINPMVLEAHSCYRASPCGVCPHCLEKQRIVNKLTGE